MKARQKCYLYFPVFFDGRAVDGLSWDAESTVESVVLMSRVEK